MAQKFAGNRPLKIIERDVKKAGGEWDDSRHDVGSDYVTFTFRDRVVVFNTFNGKFIVKEGDDIITEESTHMDGVDWYDALLALIYEPLKAKVAA